MDDNNKKTCQYGEKCYRKNKLHIKQYHTTNSDSDNDSNEPPNKIPKNTNDDNNEQQATPSSQPSPTLLDIIKMQERIQRTFLVKMPDDFFELWKFCITINPDKPQDTFAGIGLSLAGPFDLLLKDGPPLVNINNPDMCLLHHRYYYDPPEFQTILISNENEGEYHIGYYRDDPDEMPCFVASNDPKKDCTITIMAESIFGALLVYLEEAKKKSPFKSMICHQWITKLKLWAKTEDVSIEISSIEMKKRQKTVVAKTFHGAGIVVPFDRKTELGYRPLIEKDTKLKMMLQNFIEAEDEVEKKAALAKLQPVITMANIATDECDFGTGLEIGIDFFCMGSESLHSFATKFLSIAYSMLDRDVFAKISDIHLKNRRRGNKVSIRDFNE